MKAHLATLTILVELVLPLCLRAQITFERTHGHGTDFSSSRTSEIQHGQSWQPSISAALPSDSMVLHPESSLNSTGTLVITYEGQGAYLYLMNSGRLIYYNVGGVQRDFGFSRFELSTLPTGRQILSASLRYFQTEAPSGPTQIFCNNTDPHYAPPRELFSGARSTTALESLPDTGWVTREVDSVGRNTILHGRVTGKPFTAFIVPQDEAGEGLAQGYDSPAPPALALTLSSPLSRDAATIGVLVPADSVCTDDTIIPLAIIGNFGNQDGDVAVPVRMRIASTSYVSDTTLSIPSGAIETLGFRPWRVPSHGTWCFRCSTMLAGDSLQEDDAAWDTTLAMVGNDIGTVRINCPAASVDSGDTVRPFATVQNYGLRAGICVAVMKIGTFYIDTSRVAIGSGSSGSICFKNWIPDRVGTWVVKCTTITDGDENHNNDCVRDTVRVLAAAVAEPKTNPPRASALSLSCEPNPSSGTTRISLTPHASSSRPLTLRMYDSQGRMVLSRKVSTSSFPLSTSDLPSGAYFIRCDAAGEHAMARVVLQR
jgi:hypothetical protein